MPRSHADRLWGGLGQEASRQLAASCAKAAEALVDDESTPIRERINASKSILDRAGHDAARHYHDGPSDFDLLMGG